jgi:hypothetical protein
MVVPPAVLAPVELAAVPVTPAGLLAPVTPWLELTPAPAPGPVFVVVAAEPGLLLMVPDVLAPLLVPVPVPMLAPAPVPTEAPVPEPLTPPAVPAPAPLLWPNAAGVTHKSAAPNSPIMVEGETRIVFLPN